MRHTDGGQRGARTRQLQRAPPFVSAGLQCDTKRRVQALTQLLHMPPQRHRRLAMLEATAATARAKRCKAQKRGVVHTARAVVTAASDESVHEPSLSTARTLQPNPPCCDAAYVVVVYNVVVTDAARRCGHRKR